MKSTFLWGMQLLLVPKVCWSQKPFREWSNFLGLLSQYLDALSAHNSCLLSFFCDYEVASLCRVDELNYQLELD